jgi:LPS sulfotransferase NodH
MSNWAVKFPVNLCMPREDYVDQQFDDVKEGPLRKIIVLLSTPRSGSTLVCDFLRQYDVCVMHEYFQPYQYMPILAERWGCLDNGSIQISDYVNSLIKYRTSESGVLGINVHGGHLEYLDAALEYFDVPVQYVLLTRLDPLSQAVSYEVAHQTKKWSSEYASLAEPVYDFNCLNRRLRSLNDQNSKNYAFLYKCKASYDVLVYEEMIKTPSLIADLFEVSHDESVYKPTLKKQSNNLNSLWLSKFSEDLLSYRVKQRQKGSAGSIKRLYSRIKRFIK